MNRKIVAAMVALPVGVMSLLTQSATAAEIRLSPEANQSSIVAQRVADHRDFDSRRGDRREQDRRSTIRQQEVRRNSIRRDVHQRVWIPAHWESGFLGIGRKWVSGHWENR